MRRGISQSAINLYRKCPYAWYFKYIEEKEPMFPDHNILDVGSQVHEAIDIYYKMHYFTKASSTDILMETYNILRRKWDITLLPEQLKKAYVCIENFSKWEYNNICNKIQTKPCTEIEINIDGFYGIIDYADIINSIAVDFKTNKYPNIYDDYNVQAAIYKILYELQFDSNLKQFKFFFLYPNVIKNIKYDTEKMNLLAKEVEQQKNEIIHIYESKEYPKKPKKKKECERCLYRFYCVTREEYEQTSIRVNVEVPDLQ